MPPKEINFEDIQPRPQAAAEAPKPSVIADEGPTAATEQLVYANRFSQQRYHPVVLIGSAAAGKTVMLLSLLAYFKSNSNDGQLSVFFGEDLFKAVETNLRSDANRYFERTVADYVRGTADAATKIGKPMFIPAKVSGQDRTELKFAFMESDGEWYQPNRGVDAPHFIAPFKPELEALLKQYQDGISFLWVAPHMAPSATTSGLAADAEESMRQANESLLGAMQNYEALRRQNSHRDTHMFVVTKWDTHVSEFSPADIRMNLDRAMDPIISHEVDNFILKTYGGPYGRFQALNSPMENKVVFRYSAGLFDQRIRGDGTNEEMLRTYPRDIWNWLYEGMRKAHEWDLKAGPLIPIPPRPAKTLMQKIYDLLDRILG